MGVKYAKAMGAEVYVITSSPNKEKVAIEYGADIVIISGDKAAVESARRRLDLIIDTIPGKHDLGMYLDMLNVDGTLVQVGPIATDMTFNALLQRRTSIAGSGIGSVSETKEMLQFSAEHNIVPDIEVINMSKINEAWDSMVAKQMSHRYVIDIENSFL